MKLTVTYLTESTSMLYFVLSLSTFFLFELSTLGVNKEMFPSICKFNNDENVLESVKMK